MIYRQDRYISNFTRKILDSQNKDTNLKTRKRPTKMKYSIEVETNSRVYESPCSSGFGTPANGRGTPSRQLNWAIEVDIMTGEPMQVTMDDANIGRVNAEKLAKKMSAVKRISRVEKDEELIQKAMRKKSRKVSEDTLIKGRLKWNPPEPLS